MSEEQALIGALIQKPSRIPEVDGILRDGDLLGDAGKAYSTLRRMFELGKHIDLVTVSTALKGVVPPAWLAESTDVGTPAAATIYAEAIASRGKARRIKQALTTAIRSAETLGPEVALEEILATYSAEAGPARNDATAPEVAKRFDDVVEENKARGYRLGVPTGYYRLDSHMVEYVPSHCWVIGAPPGGGKTALAVDMLCRTSAKAILISTESSEEQVVARYIANQTGINPKLILSGNVAGEAAAAVDKAKARFAKSGIRIYDSIYELSDIKAEVRKAAMQGGIDLVIVDFVQNCTVRGIADEYLAQTELAKQFQALMKEVRACGVFFSQLSEDFIDAIGKGGLKFKGSGSWKIIADIGAVIQTHTTEPQRRKIDIRKNRDGPHFELPLCFNSNFTRLEEA